MVNGRETNQSVYEDNFIKPTDLMAHLPTLMYRCFLVGRFLGILARIGSWRSPLCFADINTKVVVGNL